MFFLPQDFQGQHYFQSLWMKDIGLDWVEMKGKGLESVDAENSIKQASTLIQHFREETFLFSDREGDYLGVFVYKIFPVLTCKTHV